jgi:pimeloyl-ACP methyl ester carboxylesterase
MNGEELQLLPVSAGSEGPVSIAYRFRKPKENQPTFVWFCGFKSEMESVKANALAAWAQANGAGCLRFDYSGHGKSGGRFEAGTIGAWLDQAAALCRHVLGDGPAVFVGSSMGGWIALLLARRFYTEVHLKGIVLIAPAWDMTRLFWERAPAETRESILRDGVYYRPSAYGDGPYAITKALIEDGERHLFGAGPVPLAVPIRILHGCQDPDVPWRRSLSLLDVIACPDMRLTLIKDGEHRLSRPGDLALLFTTLAEFL